MTDVAHLDPRLPVVVGVGQLNQRVDRGAPELEPTDLIAEALRLAAADAGEPRLLEQADTIAVVHMLSWRYHDPGRLVGRAIGNPDIHTVHTPVGGNVPQALVNKASRDIRDGRADVVLVGGAEAWRSRAGHRAGGGRPPWTVEPEGTEPDEMYGADVPLSSESEMGRGILMPVQVYPLFENAWRAANGWTIPEHLDRLARLWSRFSEVAAGNPNAWIQRAYSPDELASGADGNRMIGFPYRKLFNSNNAVEQSAALIVCSVEKARALGVPTDRWVFPHAGTDAHDTWFVSNRSSLCASPAIRIAGRRAMELAGTGPDDLAHVDLYSCFPSAVQIAAAELGLDHSRPLTVTGGLSFAGGPWNNYVSHSIATMVDRLRGTDGDLGLCTANGGYLTKHAFGVYGNRPPEKPFLWEEPQAAVDATGTRELCEAFDGPVTIEGYTVMHDREGEPEVGLTAVRLPDERRAWASTRDKVVLRDMETEEYVGRDATLTADGNVSF
jgi:acetyl-CoA C-acetyltransferase